MKCPDVKKACPGNKAITIVTRFANTPGQFKAKQKEFIAGIANAASVSPQQVIITQVKPLYKLTPDDVKAMTDQPEPEPEPEPVAPKKPTPPKAGGNATEPALPADDMPMAEGDGPMPAAPAGNATKPAPAGNDTKPAPAAAPKVADEAGKKKEEAPKAPQNATKPETGPKPEAAPKPEAGPKPAAGPAKGPDAPKAGPPVSSSARC